LPQKTPLLLLLLGRRKKTKGKVHIAILAARV
jgi:hypothetical protein